MDAYAVALRDAIEEVYTAFAAYPLRHPIVGCTCCVSRFDQQQIAAKPLRCLAGYDLRRFIWKAMSTWGDENDFRHFLPRILELVSDVHERRDLPDLFIIFGKLRYGQYQTWPHHEREAIAAYLQAFWCWLLAGHPGCTDENLQTSEYLEALLDGVDDLMPLLRIWREIRVPSACRQLAEFVRNHAWGSRLARNKQILSWLTEDETRKLLEESFYIYIDEAWAEELALAVEILEWLQKSS